MVRIKSMVIAFLVVILAIVAWVYLVQSDTKKVKKQFDSLSKQVSKERGENPIAMASKAKNIATLFAETCELNDPISGLPAVYTPGEMASYAANSRIAFSELSLKFYDFNIEFPETGLARVALTGNLRGRLMNGNIVDETREVQCVLKKIGRNWLFSEIEVVEVLKR
jgi:hypothetical protein